MLAHIKHVSTCNVAVHAIVQALDIAYAVQICQEWRDHPDNKGESKFSIDFVASKDEALTDREKTWHTPSTDEVKKVETPHIKQRASHRRGRFCLQQVTRGAVDCRSYGTGLWTSSCT